LGFDEIVHFIGFNYDFRFGGFADFMDFATVSFYFFSLLCKNYFIANFLNFGYFHKSFDFHFLAEFLNFEDFHDFIEVKIFTTSHDFANLPFFITIRDLKVANIHDFACFAKNSGFLVIIFNTVPISPIIAKAINFPSIAIFADFIEIITFLGCLIIIRGFASLIMQAILSFGH